MTVPGRLQQIRDRLDKATPGPWRVEEHGAGPLWPDRTDLCVTGGGLWIPFRLRRRIRGRFRLWLDSEPYEEGAREDADLIAHCPEDVRLLLDVAEAAVTFDEHVQLNGGCHRGCPEHDDLRDALARLGDE